MLIPWIHDLLVYFKYLKLAVGWLASIHWKMTCFGWRKSESIYAAFMPCSSLRNPFIPWNWSILVSMCFMCLFFWIYFLPQYFFLPPFQKQPLQKDFFQFFLPSKNFRPDRSKVWIRLIPQTCHRVPGKDWSLSFSLRVTTADRSFPDDSVYGCLWSFLWASEMDVNLVQWYLNRIEQWHTHRLLPRVRNGCAYPSLAIRNFEALHCTYTTLPFHKFH